MYLPTTSQSSQSTPKTLSVLKREGEDYEWYPTTQQMITVIADDIKKAHSLKAATSILDIGAGDGRVLHGLYDALDDLKLSNHYEKLHIQALYAIEKASEHPRQWRDKITFVGGDFWSTHLASLNARITVSNPPYSQYEAWAENILKHIKSAVIYLIIPTRWQASEKIQAAMNKAEWLSEVIYSGDFENAERKARASIHIVRFYREPNMFVKRNMGDAPYSFESHRGSNDPFSQWFDATFPQIADLGSPYKMAVEESEKRKNEVFKTHYRVADLVAFYDKEMQQVQDNLNTLASLDRSLFKSLHINVDKIKETVSDHIRRLRVQYWQHFFNNYRPIRERLTSKFVKKLSEGILDDAKNIDFNVINALMVTEMVIARASEYQSEQVIDFFTDLACQKSIKAYKSNEKVFGYGRWRYHNEDYSHFALDYRIVQHRLFNIDTGYKPSDVLDGLNKVVDDITVIARLVGMPIVKIERNYEEHNYINETFTFGKRYIVNYTDMTGKASELFAIKFYQNGNQHLFLNQKFALRLNVMAGKLLGWLKNHDEAWEEMQVDDKDIDRKTFNKIFDDMPNAKDLSLTYNAQSLLKLTA